MNSMGLKLISLFALLLALPSTSDAKMYKWTDAEGNVQYSAEPPLQGDAEEIKAPPKIDTGAAQKSLQNLKSQQKKQDEATSKAKEEKSKVDADAEVRNANCETAKKNLNTYQTAGTTRLYKNSSGEFNRYGEDDLNLKIQASEESIQKYCGP